MKTQLFDDIECPICLEIPEKEIFQCGNGHSYCGSCAKNIEDCPQCRIPFTRIRNRALESLLDKIKFECENKLFGCQAKIRRQQIVGHRNHCKYRTNNGPNGEFHRIDPENRTYVHQLKYITIHLKEIFAALKISISEMKKSITRINLNKWTTAICHFLIIVFIVLLTLLVEVYH